jgi:hypothetical protein
MRAGLRVGALAVALYLPLIIGGLISGAFISTLAICVMSVCIYLTFWTALTLKLTPATRTGL